VRRGKAKAMRTPKMKRKTKKNDAFIDTRCVPPLNLYRMPE
jgi:hypothetical protein